ncbi:MAG: hypothetical protein IKN72_06435 [Clostridia bacterium]|nr:hypothetical protein [Clostridia bacterium]
MPQRLTARQSGGGDQRDTGSCAALCIAAALRTFSGCIDVTPLVPVQVRGRAAAVPIGVLWHGTCFSIQPGT